MLTYDTTKLEAIEKLSRHPYDTGTVGGDVITAEEARDILRVLDRITAGRRRLLLSLTGKGMVIAAKTILNGRRQWK